MSSNNQQQKKTIQFGHGEAGNAVQPCGTWIEIGLEDEQGNPVPYERYCIIGPGGEQRVGRLDENGFAHETGLKPQDCQVTFPDR